MGTIIGIVVGLTVAANVILTNLPEEPDPISNLSAINNKGEIRITWQSPASDGGSPITDYIIEYKRSSDSTFSIYNDGVGSSTSVTLTGLTKGSSYDFRVMAENEVGQSPESKIVSTIPMVIPFKITTLQISSDSTNVFLSWAAPYDGGSPITDYIIEYKRSSDSTFSIYNDGVGSSTGATLTGLTKGSSYDFIVMAENEVGQSPESKIVSTILEGQPDKIRNVRALLTENGQISLSWAAPYDGGSPITDYIIEYKRSSDSTFSIYNDGKNNKTNSMLSGLENGVSYDFKVTAVNKLGQGPNSDITDMTPLTKPHKISNLNAISENGQISLSWAAPYDGGSPITDYIIEYKRSSDESFSIYNNGGGSSTVVLLNGLAKNVLYYFQVSAVNEIGQGIKSEIISSEIESFISPIAKISLSSNTFITGQNIAFSASESDDEDGEIITYNWDFCGISKSGEAVTHKTFTNEVIIVTLTVIDDVGLIGEDQVAIKIYDGVSENPPPLERIAICSDGLFDTFNNPIQQIDVGEYVKFAGDITTNMNTEHSAAMLIQMQNENGVTKNLTPYMVNLIPGEIEYFEIGWIPEEQGEYDLTFFVWESIDNPTAMYPPKSYTLTVK
ncbi:hypothetical protein C5F47_03480 [Nitrosopumilus cobalaminigenes]|uniref:Fibronectin type-III domain-containing protein n=2 Tax=Nitrosopumilus cobalaminigenes TaxID=1470066 RepID=A0A7D5RBK0_9ARCH|nr:hypothetical protein C5F47_03480 [Nitrosopumilus cobalaminigenes]